MKESEARKVQDKFLYNMALIDKYKYNLSKAIEKSTLTLNKLKNFVPTRPVGVILYNFDSELKKNEANILSLQNKLEKFNQAARSLQSLYAELKNFSDEIYSHLKSDRKHKEYYFDRAGHVTDNITKLFENKVEKLKSVKFQESKFKYDFDIDPEFRSKLVFEKVEGDLFSLVSLSLAFITSVTLAISVLYTMNAFFAIQVTTELALGVTAGIEMSYLLIGYMLNYSKYSSGMTGVIADENSEFLPIRAVDLQVLADVRDSLVKIHSLDIDLDSELKLLGSYSSRSNRKVS